MDVIYCKPNVGDVWWRAVKKQPQEPLHTEGQAFMMKWHFADIKIGQFVLDVVECSCWDAVSYQDGKVCFFFFKFFSFFFFSFSDWSWFSIVEKLLSCFIFQATFQSKFSPKFSPKWISTEQSASLGWMLSYNKEKNRSFGVHVGITRHLGKDMLLWA